MDEIEDVTGFTNYLTILQHNRRRERFTLSKHAVRSKSAIRRQEDPIPDRENIRQAFTHDSDRIMHCPAYARYIDKTQVFFLLENDEITHRVLHVQFVSKIARTIARCLRMNEDLVEAIALGHDIGHTPFGHAGEEFLQQILKKREAGTFVHNAQSVRLLDTLENKGFGLNLTLQVLDGILGHNGELLDNQLKPADDLKWDILNQNLNKCFEEPKADRTIRPCTLEGCIVRVSDIISYIGRDIEDAIAVELIHREDLPQSIVKVLGDSNASIINTLVMDVINTSQGKDWIGFSDDVYSALSELKQFNYERIYFAPTIKEEKSKLKRVFEDLFGAYMDDLRAGNENSDLFRLFLSSFTTKYRQDTRPERIVTDFIAGMTDDFLRDQFSKRFVPRSLGYKLRQNKFPQ